MKKHIALLFVLPAFIILQSCSKVEGEPHDIANGQTIRYSINGVA
jgi:hypothetical protein